MASPDIDAQKKKIIDSVSLNDVRGVNYVIDALRTRFYGEKLGHIPPLVSGETNMRESEKVALRTRRVSPNDLPVVSFAEEVINHPVKLGNFSAILGEIPNNPAKRSSYYYDSDPDLLTELLLGADVRTLGGRDIGTLHMGYTLFMRPTDAVFKIPRLYGDLLPKQEIHSGTIRPLFYRSTRLESGSWRGTMQGESARHASSRRRAAHVEGLGITSPLRGGLPGSGKQSR